jgi:hypothetical protein
MGAKVDVWKVNLGLGFDFGDFNDWTERAAKPGAPQAKHFQAYALSLKAVKAGEEAFWIWAKANVDEPGFDAGFKQWWVRLAGLERQAVKALEELLKAYRLDWQERPGDENKL